MLGAPMFGFKFDYLKDPRYRPAVLERMGELSTYREVLAFQITFNLARTSSRLLPDDQRITGSQILEDGIYAGETDGALQRYITYLVRRGQTGCGSVTSAEVRTIGPSAVRQCLVASGMAGEAVSVMQQARDEWKDASRAPRRTGPTPPPITDPYAAARVECAAAGRTWNTTTNTCTPAGAAEDTGMGAGTWFLLIALGAAVAGGIWYVANE